MSGEFKLCADCKLEEGGQATLGQLDTSNSLAPVVEKFKHLDMVLRSCEKSEDAIYRTCAELWIVICEYQKRV